MVLKKFFTGQVFDAYEYFGAHLEQNGIVFRTYAPNAARISIIGEFNNWHEEDMERIHKNGIWSFFTPYARVGQMYKYVIYGKKGRVEHCDPYGFGMEFRPGSCSIIRNLKEYHFKDQVWMRTRKRNFDKPLNIYELHLGSWRKKWNAYFSYSEIADELIRYLMKHGYNCVEFMPLAEHPFDGSWGYQGTGYFAPTSRYGTASQLMELIDRLHHVGISAIIDFVPVHFAVDKYGLREYDGTPLYEYPNKKDGKSEWGSYNFNHGRGEVISFLQSAANYWLKEYHFDGIRMDAVSRLIYRKGDEGNGINLDGHNFLRSINKGLHKLHPTAMLIAEDSTAYPGITKDVNYGGFGFDYKWDMGWVYDTMQYLERHPDDRKNLGHRISFSFHYAYNENYILPFSHDESARGGKPVINRLYGSYEDKFAQLKTLYLYMMTHPGKKLNFMGNELAMFREWDVHREPDWDLLNYPAHDSFHTFIQELNALYLNRKSLWQSDHSRDGFQWVGGISNNECVFAYTRASKNEVVLTILNFSDKEAQIHPIIHAKVSLLLHTDWECFGGKVKKVLKRTVPDTIPAYSGMLLKLMIYHNDHGWTYNA